VVGGFSCVSASFFWLDVLELVLSPWRVAGWCCFCYKLLLYMSNEHISTFDFTRLKIYSINILCNYTLPKIQLFCQ
jgi:hypothetical protein